MPITEKIYGYYQFKDEAGKLIETGVRAKVEQNGKLEPGPDIPNDEGNVDWQNYKKWLAEGGKVEHEVT